MSLQNPVDYTYASYSCSYSLFANEEQAPPGPPALSDGQGGTYNVSQIYSFGDRLSDTGNTAALEKSLGQPTPLTVAPFSSGGDFSNGPNWITDLKQSLGVSSSDTQANFAYESATARAIANPFDPNQPQTNLTDFAGQIGQFEQTGNTFSPTDLVTVTFGDYDLTLPNDLPPDQAVSLSVNAITAGLQQLADLGAQHFLVANLRFVALAPEASIPAAASASSIDPKSLYDAFNSELSVGLETFEASTGLDVKQLDLFSLFNDIAANPADFGFTNVAQPILLSGTAPGSTPIYNPAINGQDPAVEHSTLFLDPFYDATTMGQAIMAQTAVRTLAA